MRLVAKDYSLILWGRDRMKRENNKIKNNRNN